MDPKAKPLDLAAYAAIRGVSKVAVHKAVTSGRLKGCLVYDARGRAKIADVELAHQEWAAHTQQRVDHEPLTDAPVQASLREREKPKPKPSKAPVLSDVPDYHESRARREAAEARRAGALAEIAELDAAERRGDLVPVDQARSDVTAVFASLRTKLLAIPSRVAQRLPGQTGRDAAAIVESLVRETLEDMAEIRLGEAEEKA